MSIYNDKFYNNQKNGSYQSAKIILPYILRLVNPKSILDVGCGLGTWLEVAKENRIHDIQGLDGTYVSVEKLRIPTRNFMSSDLTKPPKLNRHFDLTISLEVAEHLPKSNAIKFVSYLTKHSDYILFSAAVPNQGGTNHVNEQWQSYWQKIFNKYEYVPIDCVRPYTWNNKEVEWWYSQNIILYVNKKTKLPRTLTSLKNKTCTNMIDLVHPIKLQTVYKSRSFMQKLFELFISLHIL